MKPRELDETQDVQALREALRKVLAHATTLREAAQNLLAAWTERPDDSAMHVRPDKLLPPGHRYGAIQRSLCALHDALSLDDARAWLDRMWALETIALEARRIAKNKPEVSPVLVATVRDFEKTHGALRLPATGVSVRVPHNTKATA